MYELEWRAKNDRIGGIFFESFGQAEKYANLYFNMKDVYCVIIIDTESGHIIYQKEKAR